MWGSENCVHSTLAHNMTYFLQLDLLQKKSTPFLQEGLSWCQDLASWECDGGRLGAHLPAGGRPLLPQAAARTWPQLGLLPQPRWVRAATVKLKGDLPGSTGSPFGIPILAIPWRQSRKSCAGSVATRALWGLHSPPPYPTDTSLSGKWWSILELLNG